MKLEELQKNKKLLVVILSAVGILAIILNLQTFGITWVSEKDVLAKKEEAEKLTEKVKELQAEYKYEEDKIWNLNALLRNFWQPKFDGDGMEAFKPLVEKLAKESNIKFSYIGNVRRSGSSGLVSYSVPISGSAPFSVLLPFMSKIDKNCPHIGWQTLNLNLNRSNETQIDFNGSLRVLCLESPEIHALLDKVTKPNKPTKSKTVVKSQKTTKAPVTPRKEEVKTAPPPIDESKPEDLQDGKKNESTEAPVAPQKEDTKAAAAPATEMKNIETPPVAINGKESETTEAPVTSQKEEVRSTATTEENNDNASQANNEEKKTESTKIATAQPAATNNEPDKTDEAAPPSPAPANSQEGAKK